MSLSSHFAASLNSSSAAKAASSSSAALKAANAAAASGSPRKSSMPPPPQMPPRKGTPPRGGEAAAAVARLPASDDWPLIVGGRTAMLGFAVATAAELASSHPQPALSDLSLLASAHPLASLAVAAAVAAGSAAPVLRGEPLDSEAFGPFNAAAERANSAAALVGLLGLIAAEALKGSALF